MFQYLLIFLVLSFLAVPFLLFLYITHFISLHHILFSCYFLLDLPLLFFFHSRLTFSLSFLSFSLPLSHPIPNLEFSLSLFSLTTSYLYLSLSFPLLLQYSPPLLSVFRFFFPFGSLPSTIFLKSSLFFLLLLPPLPLPSLLLFHSSYSRSLHLLHFPFSSPRLSVSQSAPDTHIVHPLW